MICTGSNNLWSGTETGVRWPWRLALGKAKGTGTLLEDLEEEVVDRRRIVGRGSPSHGTARVARRCVQANVNVNVNVNV